jgi:hypothetical protein
MYTSGRLISGSRCQNIRYKFGKMEKMVFTQTLLSELRKIGMNILRTAIQQNL